MIWDVMAGIFMGTLTGMGIGGGGLLVLYLTGVSGMGQLEAQGCNLLFFVFASAASLFIHNKKRSLDFKLIGAAVLLALGGAQMGLSLGEVLPEDTVRRLFGWMLIISGVAAAFKVVKNKK